MPAVDTAIRPGSRWVARNRKHAEAVIEVIRVSHASVTFRQVASGGSQGNQKVDPSRQYSLDHAVFLQRHAPANALGQADAFGGGGSFRQVNAPKRKPQTIDESTVAPRKAPAMEPISNRAAPQLNIEVMVVSPLQAQAWLDRGGKNRPLAEKRVAALAAAMRRGEWQLTGEAIKLDADGLIRDGQHRLAAIVRSGVPVTTVVVRGVGEEAFDVMDSGKSRAIADIVALHGHASHTGLAAAVRVLIFLDRYKTVNPGQRDAATVVTAVSTIKYIDEHPEVKTGFHMGDGLRQAGLQGGVGLWAALCTVFYRLSPEQAQEFVGFLATGAGMAVGHPALMLRNRAINKSLGFAHTVAGREELAAMAIKAWNAFREGRTLSYLAYRTGGRKPEGFPEAK